MTINEKLFQEQCRPRFGDANPERMQVAFWEWMIRGGASAVEPNLAARDESSLFSDLGAKDGIGSWPWDARRFFKMESSPCDGPIWTFQRYGATRTELPDGRVVCIGGEHEDFYDPDFHIYNDVVVFGLDKQIEILGYPKEVFPPTDFHTATLLGNKIVIIGSLGYRAERTPGFTPVFALDLDDYSISRLMTSGEAPGWISEHEALTKAEGVIPVRGGRLIEERSGEQRYARNFDDYELDVSSGIWSKITRRNWQHFSIRQKDKQMFVLERDLGPKNLIPSSMINTKPEDETRNQARIVIKGVSVLLVCGVSEIEIIVEGELQNEVAKQVVEQIRVNAEAAIKRPCVAEQL
jgi:hypothetical protein